MLSEKKRLEKVFKRALGLAIASASTAAVIACSAQNSTGGAGGDASVTTSSGVVASSGSTTSSVSGTGGVGTTSSVVASSASTGGAPDCSPNSPAWMGVEFTPDPPDDCGKHIHFPCGLPGNIQPYDQCYFSLGDCANLCPTTVFNCHADDNGSCVDGGVVFGESGSLDVDCAICATSVGRVPAGLARTKMRRPRTAIGEHFAKVAHLEAASVHAFDRLGEELEAYGAPAKLVKAAAKAKRDEIRHAKVTAKLAERFGGAAPKTRVRRLPIRSLAAIAAENAVEGCVRETFGALVAEYQARRAGDVEIAGAMKRIAKDETNHAALSWEIARWVTPRLDTRALSRLKARCDRTIDMLFAEATRAEDVSVARVAGLPDANAQRAMLSELRDGLWATL